MATKIYVNLPVKDLNVSTGFFTEIGFSFHPDFTNEDAGGLVISDDIYVMLVTEPFFKTFTSKDIADTGTTTEALITLQVESRERVDKVVDSALRSGGRPANDTEDQGFMYSRSFQDPDGHLWNVIHMDLTAGAA